MQFEERAFQCESSDFRKWRDAICDVVVDLDCSRPETDHFAGRIDSRPLRDMQVIRIAATSHNVSRDKRRVARSNSEFVLLSHIQHGRALVAQNGREALLGPGDFAIYDTTSPYDVMLADDFRMNVLRIERSHFSRLASQVSDLTARSVSGRSGIGKIVSRLITDVSAELDLVGDISFRQMNESLLGLVAVALGETAGTQGTEPVSEQRHQLVQRALRVVEDELGNEALTCDFVANRLGISYRYLMKIFAEREKSLSEMIWQRRLDEARRLLGNASAVERSVTSIAFDCGFKDSAHFSRAFRTRFGMSPRQFRKSRH